MNGRPPSLMIQHTDCRFPDDLDPCTTPSGELEHGCMFLAHVHVSPLFSLLYVPAIVHAWKFRYSVSCLSISVQHVFSTKGPSYSAVLALDAKIRKFPVPTHLHSPVDNGTPESVPGRKWSEDPSRAMQQYCVVCEIESSASAKVILLRRT